MIGGMILLIGVSLKGTDEEVVVGVLIFIEFFFNSGESFRAVVDHFDFY